VLKQVQSNPELQRSHLLDWNPEINEKISHDRWKSEMDDGSKDTG
jgi:hypothetical protein